MSDIREPTEIEEVATGLFRVPLKTPTLPPATRTNTFVICGEGRNRGIWVVDPGADDRTELRRLLAFIETRLAQGFGFGGHVVTHHHPDHWGGLRWLSDRLPGPLVSTRPLLEGNEHRTPAWLESVLPGFSVIPTPGHASDHIVLLTPERDVIAGDLVAGVGTIVINPPDGDMGAYLTSLKRVRKRDPKRLFPAHGPTVEEGAARLEAYLAHRLAREVQVLQCLTELGRARPADIVPHIYAEVPALFHPIAARGVLAHLLKLASDQRAICSDGWWQLSSPP